MMNSLTMAHFRRQACGVSLRFGGGFGSNGGIKQQQPCVTSPSCLSFFTAATTRSSFQQQAPLPVDASTTSITSTTSIINKLVLPSSLLQASAVGISALRTDPTINKVGIFLPTPSQQWQDVHAELLLRVQQQQHKESLAMVLEEFLEVQFQRNDYYGVASRHDKKLHSQQMSKVFREYKPALIKTLTKMTQEDEAALSYYCNDGYWKINSALRQCTDRNGEEWHNDEATLRRVTQIQKALRKRAYETTYQGFVYRGTNIPAEVAKQLVVGATYSDAGFLSTSKASGLAFKGKSIEFVIYSLTGTSVNKFSNYNEDEILFQPNTMFRVCKMQQIRKSRFQTTTKVWMMEMV